MNLIYIIILGLIQIVVIHSRKKDRRSRESANTNTRKWGNFHFAVGSLRDENINLTSRADLPVALYTTIGRSDNKAMLYDNGEWKPDYYVSADKCDLNGYRILDTRAGHTPSDDSFNVISNGDINNSLNSAISPSFSYLPVLPQNDIQHLSNHIDEINVTPVWSCRNIFEIGYDTLIEGNNGEIVGFLVVLKNSSAKRFKTSKGQNIDQSEEKNLKLLQYWSKMLNKYLKKNNVPGFSGIIIGKRSKGLKTLVSEIYPFNLPDGFYGVLLGIPDSQKNKAVFNVSDRLHSLHWSSENEEWIESVRCMNEALVENKKWYVTKPGDIRCKLKSKICLVSAEPSSSYATDSSQWIELESKNKTNAYLVPISDNEADTNADHYSKFC